MLLTKFRQFLHRNRKRLLITSGISVFIYLTYQYLLNKFHEYQQRLTEERFSREQIKRRFEQTQKDSLYTVYSLVPVLNGVIFDSLSVEKITKDLQSRRLNKQEDDISTTTTFSTGEEIDGLKRKSKNELWNDLKIISLTRLLTLIYSQSALILLTRLQLNILARREYLEDAIKLASFKNGFIKKKLKKDENNYINEQAYLSLSWWLLNRGWISIRQRVEKAVKDTFKDITPRAELTIDEFALLINKTQHLIENDDDEFLLTSILPPSNLQNFVFQQTLDFTSCNLIGKESDSLQVLIEETQNYINSSSVSIIMNSLTTTGISTCLNIISQKLSSNQKGQKFKLAVLLANIGKVSNEFKTSPENNSFIINMDSTEGLDELSASVYSNFEV